MWALSKAPCTPLKVWSLFLWLVTGASLSHAQSLTWLGTLGGNWSYAYGGLGGWLHSGRDGIQRLWLRASFLLDTSKRHAGSRHTWRLVRRRLRCFRGRDSNRRAFARPQRLLSGMPVG